MKSVMFYLFYCDEIIANNKVYKDTFKKVFNLTCKCLYISVMYSYTSHTCSRESSKGTGHQRESAVHVSLQKSQQPTEQKWVKLRDNKVSSRRRKKQKLVLFFWFSLFQLLWFNCLFCHTVRQTKIITSSEWRVLSFLHIKNVIATDVIFTTVRWRMTKVP